MSILAILLLVLILIILMLMLSSIFIRSEPILVHAFLVPGFVHAWQIGDRQVIGDKE